MANKVVALDGGLVDIGSVANTESANIKDCLNYERGIEHGYTRCDGFSRWDGRQSVLETSEVIAFVSDLDAGATMFVIGTTYTASDASGNTAQVVCQDRARVTDSGFYIHYGWFIFSGATIIPTSIVNIGPYSGTATLESASSYSSVETAYRTLVTALPMSTVGKIAGAHFFRNRNYVIADYAAFTVTGLNTLNLKEGASVTKVSGGTVIGTLVGYRDVGGIPNTATASGTATLIIRAYTGVVPANGDDINVAGNTGKVADFGAFTQSTRAGLYYADYNGAGGWNHVDAGRRMRYKLTASCSAAGFLRYTRNGFGTDIAALTAVTVTPAAVEIRTGEHGNWVETGPITPPTVSAIASAGGNVVLAGLGTGSGTNTGNLVIRYGTAVAAAIPSGAVVVGIKVTISRANSSASGTIRDHTVTLTGLTGPAPQNKADLVSVWPLSSAYADAVYGGIADTWGSQLKTEDVRSADFGLVIGAQQTPATTICVAAIDKVTLEITYSEQTATVYVRRGASDITNFKTVHYTIDNGETFASKLAEGTIVVTGLDTVYARSAEIAVGDELRTASGGGGSLLAYINSLDEPLTLPSSDVLADAGTRWTFTTCDPWAVDDSDVMIACSGVEEAYGFDGTYLLPIGTGLKPAQEVPRHSAYFQNQLFLGYPVGIVQASDVGEILLYSGGDAGAAELGLSDRITGLLPMRGQALAVFTERTIRAIYSDGAGTFDIKMISPSSGAIEYTVADMGVPVFADFRGFATLSAVQEYGDFQRGRLTNKATRLMLSRLQFETRNQTIDKRPVAALAVRNKNQYRLYCKDGYVLTLTMAGDEMDPNITKQRLFISGSNTDANAVRVLALCAGVTTEGRDVAFFTADNQSTMYTYVYQIDAGRSFDTGAIVAYVELQPEFVGSLSTLKRFDRVNVFGKAYGSASLTMKVNGTYSAPSGSRTFVLGSTSNTPGTDPEPYVTMVDAPIDAYGLSLRFDSSTATELPHTLQVIDIHYKETNQAKR